MPEQPRIILNVSGALLTHLGSDAEVFGARDIPGLLQWLTGFAEVFCAYLKPDGTPDLPTDRVVAHPEGRGAAWNFQATPGRIACTVIYLDPTGIDHVGEHLTAEAVFETATTTGWWLTKFTVKTTGREPDEEVRLMIAYVAPDSAPVETRSRAEFRAALATRLVSEAERRAEQG